MAHLPYRNVIQHGVRRLWIQTEDAGLERAYVETRLVAEDGRVVATKKTGYADWIGRPDLGERVKGLMQAHHRAMFIAVREGVFDADEEAGAQAFARRAIEIEGLPLAPPTDPERPN